MKIHSIIIVLLASFSLELSCSKPADSKVAHESVGFKQLDAQLQLTYEALCALKQQVAQGLNGKTFGRFSNDLFNKLTQAVTIYLCSGARDALLAAVDTSMDRVSIVGELNKSAVKRNNFKESEKFLHLILRNLFDQKAINPAVNAFYSVIMAQNTFIEFFNHMIKVSQPTKAAPAATASAAGKSKAPHVTVITKEEMETLMKDNDAPQQARNNSDYRLITPFSIQMSDAVEDAPDSKKTAEEIAQRDVKRQLQADDASHNHEISSVLTQAHMPAIHFKEVAEDVSQFNYQPQDALKLDLAGFAHVPAPTLDLLDEVPPLHDPVLPRSLHKSRNNLIKTDFFPSAPLPCLKFPTRYSAQLPTHDYNVKESLALPATVAQLPAKEDPKAHEAAPANTSAGQSSLELSKEKSIQEHTVAAQAVQKESAGLNTAEEIASAFKKAGIVPMREQDIATIERRAQVAYNLFLLQQSCIRKYEADKSNSQYALAQAVSSDMFFNAICFYISRLRQHKITLDILSNPDHLALIKKRLGGTSLEVLDYIHIQLTRFADHRWMYERVVRAANPQLQNLIDAVQTDNEKDVAAIAKTIDVDQIDQFGFTPLHYAAIKGNPIIIDSLLDNRADIALVNDKGALPCLLYMGDSLEIQAKLNPGELINGKPGSMPPLISAIFYPYHQDALVVRALLDRKETKTTIIYNGKSLNQWINQLLITNQNTPFCVEFLIKTKGLLQSAVSREEAKKEADHVQSKKKKKKSKLSAKEHATAAAISDKHAAAGAGALATDTKVAQETLNQTAAQSAAQTLDHAASAHASESQTHAHDPIAEFNATIAAAHSLTSNEQLIPWQAPDQTGNLLDAPSHPEFVLPVNDFFGGSAALLSIPKDQNQAAASLEIPQLVVQPQAALPMDAMVHNTMQAADSLIDSLTAQVSELQKKNREQEHTATALQAQKDEQAAVEQRKMEAALELERQKQAKKLEKRKRRELREQAEELERKKNEELEQQTILAEKRKAAELALKTAQMEEAKKAKAKALQKEINERFDRAKPRRIREERTAKTVLQKEFFNAWRKQAQKQKEYDTALLEQPENPELIKKADEFARSQIKKDAWHHIKDAVKKRQEQHKEAEKRADDFADLQIQKRAFKQLQELIKTHNQQADEFAKAQLKKRIFALIKDSAQQSKDLAAKAQKFADAKAKTHAVEKFKSHVKDKKKIVQLKSLEQKFKTEKSKKMLRSWKKQVLDKQAFKKSVEDAPVQAQEMFMDYVTTLDKIQEISALAHKQVIEQAKKMLPEITLENLFIKTEEITDLCKELELADKEKNLKALHTKNEQQRVFHAWRQKRLLGEPKKAVPLFKQPVPVDQETEAAPFHNNAAADAEKFKKYFEDTGFALTPAAAQADVDVELLSADQYAPAQAQRTLKQDPAVVLANNKRAQELFMAQAMKYTVPQHATQELHNTIKLAAQTKANMVIEQNLNDEIAAFQIARDALIRQDIKTNFINLLINYRYIEYKNNDAIHKPLLSMALQMAKEVNDANFQAKFDECVLQADKIIIKGLKQESLTRIAVSLSSIQQAQNSDTRAQQSAAQPVPHDIDNAINHAEQENATKEFGGLCMQQLKTLLMPIKDSVEHKMLKDKICTLIPLFMPHKITDMQTQREMFKKEAQAQIVAFQKKKEAANDLLQHSSVSTEQHVPTSAQTAAKPLSQLDPAIIATMLVSRDKAPYLPNPLHVSSAACSYDAAQSVQDLEVQSRELKKLCGVSSKEEGEVPQTFTDDTLDLQRRLKALENASTLTRNNIERMNYFLAAQRVAQFYSDRTWDGARILASQNALDTQASQQLALMHRQLKEEFHLKADLGEAIDALTQHKERAVAQENAELVDAVRAVDKKKIAQISAAGLPNIDKNTHAFLRWAQSNVNNLTAHSIINAPGVSQTLRSYYFNHCFNNASAVMRKSESELWRTSLRAIKEENTRAASNKHDQYESRTTKKANETGTVMQPAVSALAAAAVPEPMRVNYKTRLKDQREEYINHILSKITHAHLYSILKRELPNIAMKSFVDELDYDAELASFKLKADALVMKHRNEIGAQKLNALLRSKVLKKAFNTMKDFQPAGTQSHTASLMSALIVADAKHDNENNAHDGQESQKQAKENEPMNEQELATLIKNCASASQGANIFYLQNAQKLVQYYASNGYSATQLTQSNKPYDIQARAELTRMQTKLKGKGGVSASFKTMLTDMFNKSKKA